MATDKPRAHTRASALFYGDCRLLTAPDGLYGGRKEGARGIQIAVAVASKLAAQSTHCSVNGLARR